MTALLSRRTASIVVAATIAVGGVAVATSTAASADEGDAVTGGTTTISQPLGAVYQAGLYGFFTVPTSPASGSYDETAKKFTYSLPVSGGDGSAAAAYGSIKHDGGLIIVNGYPKNPKSVKLTNFTFSFETNTLSATPANSTKPIDVLTLAGAQTRTRDTTTGEQVVDASDTALTAAAAYYLDKTLVTNKFKAGQSLGSFHTDFTNTQY